MLIFKIKNRIKCFFGKHDLIQHKINWVNGIDLSLKFCFRCGKSHVEFINAAVENYFIARMSDIGNEIDKCLKKAFDDV